MVFLVTVQCCQCLAGTRPVVVPIPQGTCCIVLLFLGGVGLATPVSALAVTVLSF